MPCHGRHILAAEAEEEIMDLLSKEGKVRRTNREDKMSHPGCTGERVNYIIECLMCKKKEGREYT